ncbi:MAG: helix-turn-helix transcriptional regulator [Erythrobacter sp.]
MDRTPSQSKRILVLLMVSLSGLMISALPSQLLAWGPIKLGANLVAIPNVGLIWWFALSVLDDKFQIGRLAWAGMIAAISGPVLMWLSYSGLIGTVPVAIDYVKVATPVLLIFHTAWVSIASYRDDLIQPRRQARVWIVGLLLITLAIVVIVQATTSGNVSRLLRVGIGFPISILTLFWLVRFQTAILGSATVSEVGTEELSIPAKDQAVYQRLLKTIAEDKLYLESDLSIGRLAVHVGVPPHQLRTIINQGMGFRNFSAFLAHYRIADIKLLLSDPQNARTPILTIALSHGFSSITTFNRAFKNEVGQTASQFRQLAFEGSETH